MHNVLLPRTRGFVTCVNAFRGSHVQYVYGKGIHWDMAREEKK